MSFKVREDGFGVPLHVGSLLCPIKYGLKIYEDVRMGLFSTEWMYY